MGPGVQEDILLDAADLKLEFEFESESESDDVESDNVVSDNGPVDESLEAYLLC